jgi:hypothetical protein
LRYVPRPSRLSLDADDDQATWVFVVLGNTYDIKRGEWRADANSLLSAQELWFAVFMTVLFVTLVAPFPCSQPTDRLQYPHPLVHPPRSPCRG